MGAHPDDYKRQAPYHSYIHVDEYESPKELAEYLKKLDEDTDLYNSYFQWKGTGTFINTFFWYAHTAVALRAPLLNPNVRRLAQFKLASLLPFRCNSKYCTVFVQYEYIILRKCKCIPYVSVPEQVSALHDGASVRPRGPAPRAAARTT